jgi:hypothetical protein
MRSLLNGIDDPTNPKWKKYSKSIIKNIIYSLSTNLASAPPLPILGRGRGGYNFDIPCISSDWQGGYDNPGGSGPYRTLRIQREIKSLSGKKKTHTISEKQWIPGILNFRNLNMKKQCKDTNHLIYLTNDELNTDEAAILEKHLATCKSCHSERADFLKTKNLLSTFKKDIPESEAIHPSGEMILPLTDSLKNVALPRQKVKRWSKAIDILRYASGVAAIFLLGLFFWEQSIAVRQISSLEKRIQSTTTATSSSIGFIDRLTLARVAVSIQEWNNLTAKMEVYHAGLIPLNDRVVRDLFEHWVRLGKPRLPDQTPITNLTKFGKFDINTLKSQLK